MPTWWFEVILKEGTDMNDDFVEALYEAGCDDALCGQSAGVPVVAFAREAESLEAAIRSAVADVHKAGCVVVAIRIREDGLGGILASRND